MQKRHFSITVLSLLLLLGIGFTPIAHADKKYTTEVVVYVNGKTSKGRKVRLEFTGLMGGFTGSHYTNSSGVAYVKHASEGKVKVYVDGNYSNHKTQGRAPGRINVYLSK